MTKKPTHRIEELRPPDDYVVKTDIVQRIMKATKSKKKDEQLLMYVMISPDMAWDVLTLNRGNRDPTYTDIKRYAEDMYNDRWHFLGNTFKVDWDGNLIDGQKELAAIKHSETTQMYHIQCGLDPACKAAIDTGRNRTLADALKAAGFTDVNNKASAIRTILSLKNYSRVPGSLDRGQKIDNQSVLDWTKGKGNIDLLEKSINRARDWRKSAKIFTVSNFGVLNFVFHKINPLEAEFFMDKLVDPIDLNSRIIRDHNINLLRNKLNFLDSGAEHRISRDAKDERFRYVMRTWNASRDGERLDKLNNKTVDMSTPDMEKPH